MTDNINVGGRYISDARESRSKTFKLAQKNMKTKRRVVELIQSPSPSFHNSYNCSKDFTTPKRRPRIRFNGSYGEDSPNETDSPQDIIWDPNSPTQRQEDGRVIEISEIVSRIAPSVEKAKDGDSVLQWFGDSAIPCTPEIQQPRVKRISARQSSVEDLKKLAKQFDIKMTHQEDKEEEELQALFDGPTQNVSGRLSPPSVNCTPENTEPLAQAGLKSNSTASKSTPVGAHKATNFDDDWENDDLLNDSFVLEMTHNPVPLNVAQKQRMAQPESCSKKCNFVTKFNHSVSHVKSTSLETQPSASKSSTFTKTLPEVKTSNKSTFRPKTAEKLLKTSPVNQQTFPAGIDGKTKNSVVSRQTSSAQFAGVSAEDMKSLFDSNGVWNEDDDELLCKACDDVEKLTASQEQLKLNSKTLAHDIKSKSFLSIAPSSSNTLSQRQEPTKSTRVFARSNSLPCTSGSSGSGVDPDQVKSALQSKPGFRAMETSQTGRNASNSHQYTFKRHLSDSVTLTNKVFISSHMTTKCTAAEIERKKQEAIARRRSRMQACQKSGAPT